MKTVGLHSLSGWTHTATTPVEASGGSVSMAKMDEKHVERSAAFTAHALIVSTLRWLKQPEQLIETFRSEIAALIVIPVRIWSHSAHEYQSPGSRAPHTPSCMPHLTSLPPCGTPQRESSTRNLTTRDSGSVTLSGA